MANVDTEEKRWNMLQVATGPAAYSNFVNPTGSDLDTAIERFTFSNIYANPVSPTDTTAPVLSSPTGSEVGSDTATGTVTTDEGNGTLYYYASVNASETAATIKASGDNRPITTSGVQPNVVYSGLSASTLYYLHYVQDDAVANESNVQSSTSFTTDAPGSGSTGKKIAIIGSE